MAQRVRPGDPVAVLHPESQRHIVPKPNELYDDDDVLVTTYPWLFVPADGTPAAPVTSAPVVESATAAPGEKRNLPRSR